MTPTLVLVLHGTRDPAGVRTARRITAAVRTRLGGAPVALAYADVRPPGVAEVLREIGGPAVVLPVFLAAGYHVRVDVPVQVAAAGRDDGGVVVAEPVGPAPAAVAAVHDRLVTAGWRPGDAVVLAAAGSSDPRARADVRRAAALLAARVGGPVPASYLVGEGPGVAAEVAAGRDRADRVAVASWLLAPGLFHRRLAGCGADLVSAPIGAHPLLVDRIVAGYRRAAGARAGRPPGWPARAEATRRCSVRTP